MPDRWLNIRKDTSTSNPTTYMVVTGEHDWLTGEPMVNELFTFNKELEGVSLVEQLRELADELEAIL